MFFIVKTKPNTTFSIIVATCFAKNQSYTHIKVVKIIFYYLKYLQVIVSNIEIKEKISLLNAIKILFKWEIKKVKSQY